MTDKLSDEEIDRLSTIADRYAAQAILTLPHGGNPKHHSNMMFGANCAILALLVRDVVTRAGRMDMSSTVGIPKKAEFKETNDVDVPEPAPFNAEAWTRKVEFLLLKNRSLEKEISEWKDGSINRKYPKDPLGYERPDGEYLVTLTGGEVVSVKPLNGMKAGDEASLRDQITKLQTRVIELTFMIQGKIQVGVEFHGKNGPAEAAPEKAESPVPKYVDEPKPYVRGGIDRSYLDGKAPSEPEKAPTIPSENDPKFVTNFFGPDRSDEAKFLDDIAIHMMKELIPIFANSGPVSNGSLGESRRLDISSISYGMAEAMVLERRERLTKLFDAPGFKEVDE